MTSEAVIRLSWPDRRLSPNARVHWAQLAKAKQTAHMVGYWSAKDALGGHKNRLAGPVLDVKIAFHPPDNRRRDMDNMIASFKAYQDGIARAVGVDDAYWRTSYAVGEVRKRGKVVVTLNTAATV